MNVILNGRYFSEAEITRLRQYISNYDSSFEYEEKLNTILKHEFKMKLDQDDVMEGKRDPAFRRIVLQAYDERCSVCELKLITSSGISVIDAAHILPFSRFQNDDVRNGLALCKMHHWLFDHGLITVDKHYRIRVSNNIEREYPNRVISGLNNSDLTLPEEMEKIPSQVTLQWHREQIFTK